MGLRPEGSNPCRGIRRYRRKGRERFLSDEEIRRLSATLSAHADRRPGQVAVIRLLLLTGCRKSEILTLRWSDYREGHLFLRDSKTGPRTVWLSQPARRILDALERTGPWVFQAARGEREGTLAMVERESGLNTDTPSVGLRERRGRINGNLKVGADITAVQPLMANDLISSPGVKLHGSGFIVTPQQAGALGLGTARGLEGYILPYRHGRDIAQRPRGVMVIDLYPLSAEVVRDRCPKLYQHVAERVKPERDQNNRKTYRENWWIFGEPRSDLRPVLEPLGRYMATAETSKHRFFQFLDANIRPDNTIVCIGLDVGSLLAVLSSRANVWWSIEAGGWLGIGNDPRYSKSRTFDPMPFPFPVEAESDDSQSTLTVLGNRLDSFRKERLAERDFLTMTALYNVLERVRELDNRCEVPPLSAKEKDIHEAGLVSVLKEIHDDIDRAVFEAYGWADLIPALVGKPGATAPSPHKTPEQEEAEDELLSRLVALNRERAAEERRGIVRWLRPDYQKGLSPWLRERMMLRAFPLLEGPDKARAAL